MNEYAKLERPISSSVSSLQGAVHPARLRLVRWPLLQTNVQTPAGKLAFLPREHSPLAARLGVQTLPGRHRHTGAQLVASEKYGRPRISTGLNQYFDPLKKLKLSMTHQDREGTVMLLNIDFFSFAHFVVVSHNSSSRHGLVCVFMCKCVCVHVFIRSSLCSIHTRPLGAGLTSSGSHYLHTCSCLKVDLPG